ncbi:Head domain of trimeric autotransporter adhesin [Dyadobacter soli]|uniref:Head domain of trimeric autotransporter adhesin n=2 Tax=Dyadobacter soli TaxID=659014 RepID=A0A1G7ZYQ6_9BACT|nr:Head domain of trimeric autotransporter adhesin [Dyadobacter soli]
MKNAGRMILSVIALSLVSYVSEAQVGIGTTSPQAKLHVHDGAVMSTTKNYDPVFDPFYDPQLPFTDSIQFGLKWIYDKGALRAGGFREGKSDFDSPNIGLYSFASGYENSATGRAAAAIGLQNAASGSGSFAIGFGGKASGDYSFTHGYQSQATGLNSIALGSGAIANAGNSVVIGNGSTNGKTGSFVLGYGTTTVKSNLNFEMAMAFTGGYRLYTDNMSTIGVLLPANGNAWQVTSDVNKKENFAPVNGEDVLQKIGKMNLTSWNYKGQDPKTLRHYGPMAQDFYKAFGQDSYGTIGTDTTINQADFDGINLIAIQALVKKMEQMNSDLLAEIATIKTQLAEAQSALRRKNKRELISKK